jgi:hypothetical protein
MNRSPSVLFTVALLALPMLADAREVYRCRTPDGALRFGDTPCNAAAVDPALVTLRDPTAAERRRDSAQAEARARAYAEADARLVAQLEADAAGRLPASLGGSARPAAGRRTMQRAPKPEPKERACAAARADRDKAYRERGNEMDFDERRRLQDRKVSACGR